MQIQLWRVTQSLALPLAGICYVQVVALKQLKLNEGTLV